MAFGGDAGRGCCQEGEFAVLTVQIRSLRAVFLYIPKSSNSLKVAFLQSNIQQVFQFWTASYYSCGCKASEVMSPPFAQWFLTLGTALSVEDAVEKQFLAEDHDLPRNCPNDCGKLHGWQAQRLCNLPQTFIIQLDRVQQVSQSFFPQPLILCDYHKL